MSKQYYLFNIEDLSKSRDYFILQGGRGGIHNVIKGGLTMNATLFNLTASDLLDINIFDIRDRGLKADVKPEAEGFTFTLYPVEGIDLDEDGITVWYRSDSGLKHFKLLEHLTLVSLEERSHSVC